MAVIMTYYNQISEGYEELHKEEQLKKLRIISRYLKPKKTDLLLDVGCGTGITTERWKCIKTGIDPAIKLLKKAKTKKAKEGKNTPYINAEAEHLPFKNSSFDIVISITAIQNFHNIKKGIAEIKRVGKNKFILTALKKSKNISKIKDLIEENFKVKETVEEDKDFIFII